MTRPGYHFTPETGWMNDPHGVLWSGGRYHLFFQHVPGRTSWAPECCWGHAVGRDLVHWDRRGVALSPQGERGCWTGAAALDPEGVPLVLYTSVEDPDWGRGRVVAARAVDPDLDELQRVPGPPLVDGPPPEAPLAVFRDPAVWRHGRGWRMVVGGGLDGAGHALQYSSPDLRSWTYEGVLAARSAAETAGTWTGPVWECPQFFPLASSWVLVVSVWQDDVLHHVAAAVGDYDGRVFTPRRWSRLSAGDVAYATTAFPDSTGRVVLLHWLRELPGADLEARGWAGALSVPHVVDLVGDELVLAPHPDVDRLRGPALRAGPVREDADGTGARRELRVAGGQVDVVVDLPAATTTPVELDLLREGVLLVTLEVRWGHDGGPPAVSVRVPGQDRCDLSAVEAPSRLRLLLDADLLEVFAGAGFGAWRVRDVPGDTAVRLRGAPDDLEGCGLRAHVVASSTT